MQTVCACMQVLQMADTAFYFGMIDMSQRIQASIMQLRAAQLIAEGEDLSISAWLVSLKRQLSQASCRENLVFLTRT